MIRSAVRYKALDETALFGYCCRNEFPGGFINLKHGEWYVSNPSLHTSLNSCIMPPV